jgi:DNA polymerase sigma
MDILTIFLDNPEKEFHVRQIARMLKKSPTTISLHLHNLKNKKILNSRKERNHLLYQVNLDNKLVKDQKLFHNITRIRSSGLIDYLLDYYNHPSAIILFGSFRKAENISTSDIDICIITPKKQEPNFEKYEKKLKSSVQLFLITKKEIQTGKNPQLLNNIINGIVLEGNLEVFA